MLSENEVKTRLIDIARVVSAFAGKNEDFRKALSDVLERSNAVETELSQLDLGVDSTPSPFALLQEKGADGFREWVSSLAIEDLKKVISAHRLDATGNARKWKTKEKLVDFVIERVIGRSKQGDAFKDYGDTSVAIEDNLIKPTPLSDESNAT